MKKILSYILLISTASILNAQTPPICFNSAAIYNVSSNPFSVTSADFNGDGYADLVTANVSNISVLLGSSTGTLSSAVYYTAGTNPQSVTSADFNGDGKADLAVANSGGNNVSILLGSGTGTFSSAVNYATSSFPYSVTSADFNGDSKADLAVANNSGNNVSILLGSGTGTFSAPVNFAVGSGPRSITSADFNGDGKIDLATANLTSSNISVLLGSGTGTFAAAVNYPSSLPPYSITSADFNADGNSDLAVVISPSSSNGNVSILISSSTGTFATAVNYLVGLLPRALTSADYNDDGKIDIAVANSGVNNLSVLLGSNTGTFAPSVALSVGCGSQTAITSADINGDSKIDLAVTKMGSGCNSTSVLLNGIPSLTITSANFVCLGSALTLSVAGAITYTWNTGVNTSTLSISPTINTTYTVLGTGLNLCMSKAVKTISVNAVPNVIINNSAICIGNSYTIMPSGASTYTYSGGSAIVSPTTTTNYTITGATNGCANTATTTLTVYTPAIPQICMVSTEAVSNYNYNYIYWEKAGLQRVDSFIVYRFNPISNGYIRIGATHRDSTYLKDTMRVVQGAGSLNGDPNAAQWKYKLGIRDSCGNYSDINLTNWHLTEHVTMTVDGFGNAQFQVFPYTIENNSTLPNGYALYRDNLNTGNFQIVVPVTGQFASDNLFASYPQANYRIDILGFNCNVNSPLAKINPNAVDVLALKPKAISNRVPGGGNIIVTGLESENQNNYYNIYPNPSNTIFNINSLTEIGKIEVYNTLGQKVYSAIIKNKTSLIDLSTQTSGIYYLYSANGVQKLIKQ